MLLQSACHSVTDQLSKYIENINVNKKALAAMIFSHFQVLSSHTIDLT